MSIKFTANEIRYIALFENMTGAMVKDCIIDDEHGKVTFVVKNGDMGLAIGKGGSTVSFTVRQDRMLAYSRRTHDQRRKALHIYGVSSRCDTGGVEALL